MSKKPKKLSNGWEPFDDCAICQAMSRADEGGNELSEKELLDAFAEANKHSSVMEKPKIWDSMMNTVREVGPDMFNEDPEPLNLKQILIKRKEIELELEKLLDEYDSDFDLQYIKDIIYNEQDTDEMTKIISIFDDGDLMKLDSVLDIINDAWNYFPHKVLKGLCPAEKWLEK